MRTIRCLLLNLFALTKTCAIQSTGLSTATAPTRSESPILSPRQLDLLRQLAEKVGVAALPPDLQQTAEVRLENPDLSLKELGEKMQPPLGKSGMYHRLIRLEKKVAELLTEKGHISDGT